MDDFKQFAAISYARTYGTVAMHHVRKGAGEENTRIRKRS